MIINIVNGYSCYTWPTRLTCAVKPASPVWSVESGSDLIAISGTMLEGKKVGTADLQATALGLTTEKVSVSIYCNHAWDNGGITTQATCTEPGYTTHTCSKCGDSYTDTEVSAIGHSYTNYIYNNDAKVGKDGTETAACDRGCGATDTRTKSGSALEEATIVIKTQPSDVSAKVGAAAEFTVTATGTGLKYQWQYSIDSGKKWANSPATGNTTSTVTISVAANKNGYQYRCVITDGNGKTVTSSAAKLIVQPAITKQPAAVSAEVGATAKFTVTATGTGLKYQWQYSTDSGKNWSNSPAEGNTTAAVSISVAANKNGYQYRCVITDGNGKTVTSNAAKLIVQPAITKQPAAVSAEVGAAAKFTVTATGSGLKYQWEYSKDNGKTWYASPAEGNTTAAVSISVAANKNGYQYRCVIKDSNGKTVTSNSAKLTITAAGPTITKQPVGVSAIVGATAKYTVTATGIGLKYQWQYSTDSGKKWANSPATGNTTSTVTISVAANKNGYQYRCIITGGNGKTVTSSAAKLIVQPAITKQPTAVSAEVGTAAKFTVTATGSGLKYQWEYSKDNGKTWYASPAEGNTTAAVSISVAANKNGYLYRCVITDSNGKTVTSNSAKLTVNALGNGEKGNEIGLQLNKTANAAINDAGGDSYFKFTPSASGRYSFYSTADADTYGYLYDSNYNQLASNDDGGENMNFKITYSLEAGKTYYYGVHYYSNSNTGSIPVILVKD